MFSLSSWFVCVDFFFYHGLKCLKYNLFPHCMAGCRENLSYFCLSCLNYEKQKNKNTITVLVQAN